MSYTQNNGISPMNKDYWINAINTTISQPVYNTPYNGSLYNLSPYKELIIVFGLDITEEQLAKLDELYNSNDEDNKMVSAFMFKHLLTEKLK